MLLERQPALEALSRALRSAFDGAGRITVIEGEAGIGKTSLIQDFLGAKTEGCTVHWGWSEPLFTPRALGPLEDMAPLLDDEISDLLANGAIPGTLFPAVFKALMRGPDTKVLVFEDVHWADHATLDLIRFLSRRVTLLHTFIILTMRGHEVDPDHPVTQLLGDLPAVATERLVLTPLSPAAVAALAGDVDRGEQLHRVTGGNPFFVKELLAEPNGNGVPASIRDAVWARISRLPSDIRGFLETVSIAPGGVDTDLIEAMIGGNADDLIDQSVARGLIKFEDRGVLVFRHELARQATLERISPAARRALHARMETVLSLRADAISNSAILDQRLYHAAEAENGQRILELAPKVATRAAALGAHQQAVSHLSKALEYVTLAPPDAAAQLYEDWAHETFLARHVSHEAALEAHNRAISLWRSLDRPEKVCLNLCRLARLHWRRGEAGSADECADRAVRELEALPPRPELSLAYSTRSQLLMLQYRFDEAIQWGERAIALAEKLGEIETKVHALNNVGTSLALSGGAGGKERLRESLSTAIERGFHDHASRAYTNFSECALVDRDFALAESLLAEGIAFCTRHDLDSTNHYLLGRQAQLRMEQARFHDAKTIAHGVTQMPSLPLVMHLPALTVLGRVKMRLGEPEGTELLKRTLRKALTTGEPQRIIPVRLALTEAAWLAEDDEAAREQLLALSLMETGNFPVWDFGELAVWRKRCGADTPLNTRAVALPPPRLAELEGDPTTAAGLWSSVGQRYEQALSLMQVRGARAGAAFAEAVAILDDLDARPVAARARLLARHIGAADILPKQRRGPYAAARHHPLGLTANEQQVLELIVEGMSNKEIARRLARSPRTIEHQVSAVLGKFSAANRTEVLLRVRGEPWLMRSATANA